MRGRKKLLLNPSFLQEVGPAPFAQRKGREQAQCRERGMPEEGRWAGNTLLPLLRQQKGDASSEARRRGFVHHLPRQPTPSLKSFQIPHIPVQTLDNHNICSNITSRR